jgi:hypothetical protein
MSRRRAAEAGQPSCISGRLLARKCCEWGESTTKRNGGCQWSNFVHGLFANNLLNNMTTFYFSSEEDLSRTVIFCLNAKKSHISQRILEFYKSRQKLLKI